MVELQSYQFLIKPTSFMDKHRVNKSISPSRPSVKSLSPYDKICIRNSFERLVCPSGHSKAETPARRSLHGASKEGQSNKKCSVSSMPSLVGHIGLVVSLKLCLNF